MNIEIRNTRKGYVELWRELERTRQVFEVEYRRFCIRRILRYWFGSEATDEFVWEVCFRCSQEGYNLLPSPADEPMKCREFLIALVKLKLDIGLQKVNVKALDAAYSIVFPESKPINKDKKGKKPP